MVCSLQGFGEVAVNIFCREAQEAWEELFPFADDRTLKLAAEHGLPDNAAKLAELVDNDKHKFVRLLAALIRSNLRKVPIDDEKGTVDSGQALSCSVLHVCTGLPVLSGQYVSHTHEFTSALDASRHCNCRSFFTTWHLLASGCLHCHCCFCSSGC
jgi:hypothetical protein